MYSVCNLYSQNNVASITLNHSLISSQIDYHLVISGNYIILLTPLPLFFQYQRNYGFVVLQSMNFIVVNNHINRILVCIEEPFKLMNEFGLFVKYYA
jgi:hypothetical protein